MIITINDNQEVIGVYVGFGIKANNVTSFDVDSIPSKENGKLTCFDPKTMSFYKKDTKQIDIKAINERKVKNAEIVSAQQKRATALKWLADNDWMVNKIVIGEWTQSDYRWKMYLENRAKARADIEEAEATIARLK